MASPASSCDIAWCVAPNNKHVVNDGGSEDEIVLKQAAAKLYQAFQKAATPIAFDAIAERTT